MKVLSKNKMGKHISRKPVEILSSLALLFTVTVLAVCAFFGATNTIIAVSTSGNAIYHGNTDKAAVSLMFNVYEGADNVLSILEILRNHSAKATFFIGGIWAEKNQETLLKIALDGHEIGTHGYLHRDHSKMNLERNKEEIAISETLIENIIGTKIKLFAPPSGAFNDHTEEACKDLGLKLIMWTKDTIDWRDSDIDIIVKRATKNAVNGDLILMHPKAHTVRALPEIIEAYQNAAFDLVTVSEVVSP